VVLKVHVHACLIYVLAVLHCYSTFTEQNFREKREEGERGEGGRREGSIKNKLTVWYTRKFHELLTAS